MPRAKGPNTKATLVPQVVLVQGDPDNPEAFVEELNRKLAEGYTPLGTAASRFKLYAFVTKKKRVAVS